jgi:hypothetical protein
MIPNMMYHRQNSVDLHYEAYSLAVSVVNIYVVIMEICALLAFASHLHMCLFCFLLAAMCADWQEWKETSLEAFVTAVWNCIFLFCKVVAMVYHIEIRYLCVLLTCWCPYRYQYGFHITTAKHNGVVKDDIFSNTLWILCIICLASTWFTVL